MKDDKIFESLVLIHSKIDDLRSDTTDIKIAQAQLPCDVINTRLKILEKVVYGAVAIILIAFMVTLAGDKPTPAKAAIDAKTSIIMKDIKK